MQITASDGESRRIGAGEVLLVEDTWGKGHLSKALDGKLRNCIFVPDRDDVGTALDGKVVVGHRRQPGHRRRGRRAAGRRGRARGVRRPHAARGRSPAGRLARDHGARTSAPRAARRTPVTVNIADPAECERLLDAARKAYGPVDVLVNNAALTYFVPIKDYAVNKWLASWNVNVHAPFVLSQLALRDMIPRKRGAIVNIGSGAAIGPGRGPYPDPAAGARGGTCYGAQKAALERFTQGLAAEVYAHGVSVTCVSPSQVVPTPGTVYHKLVKGMDDPRGERPELMARAVLLLASEPLDRVTGRVTYSQQILKEFGWITEARGRGVDTPGTGYSSIVADGRAQLAAGGHGIFIASSRRSRSWPSARSHTSASASGVQLLGVGRRAHRRRVRVHAEPRCRARRPPAR